MKHSHCSISYYESRYNHVYKDLRGRFGREKITDMIIHLLSNKTLIKGGRISSKLILNYLYV